MRNIFLTLIVLFVSISISNADNKERLDEIESRLDAIEEKLDAFNLLNIFSQDNLNSITEKNTATSTETNQTKLSLVLDHLSCKETPNELIPSMPERNILFEYTLINNYDKQIKLIDASGIITDLLGSTLLKAGLFKEAYIEAGDQRSYKGSIDDSYSDNCRDIAQVKFEDMKIELAVDQIAFGDNEVINF
mgnify:CR=1 FL=1